jgi:hypothetical protein
MEGMSKYDCFPLTIVSSYHLVYCRSALGNGIVDCASYAPRHTSTSTSLSTCNSRAADSAAEERERWQDEMVQNLI